jgi:transcriptional regulator GlxA family with amidase domain
MAIVIFEGVQALDVAGPLDVFAQANGYLPDEDRYDCLLIGADTRPLRCSNGMRMSADLTYDQAARVFDTVLVAGGPDLPRSPADDAMSAWLRDWGCGPGAMARSAMAPLRWGGRGCWTGASSPPTG